MSIHILKTAQEEYNICDESHQIQRDRNSGLIFVCKITKVFATNDTHFRQKLKSINETTFKITIKI